MTAVKKLNGHLKEQLTPKSFYMRQKKSKTMQKKIIWVRKKVK